MNSRESNEAEALPAAGRRPDTPAHAAQGRGSRLVFLGVVIVVLLGLAYVAGLVPRRVARAQLNRDTRELAVLSVSVVNAAPSKAAGAPALPAEVKPWVESPIYARANGYLKRWTADLGATVEAGQLLAEIEAPEINQDLAKVRADLSQGEAALTLAKTTAARWELLRKAGTVSDQELSEKQAELALKNAAVAAARATVTRLEEMLSFTRIVAPFAGTITSRRTDVGELIVAGSGKELFRLAQTGRLRVFVQVPQTLTARIVVGQAAELLLPELAGRAIPARVARTSGMVNPDSRTVLTELEVENPKGEILAGSYAQVRFTETRGDAVLSLPAHSLLFRSEGAQVAVVRADDTVELRGVTMGRDFGATVEILAGVSASERVILNPLDSLVNGTRVRVVELPTVEAGK